MNRFIKHYFLPLVAVFATVLNGCENEIPSSTYPEKKAWHTVFSDNFNREDGELGDDWTVDSLGNSTLRIADNRTIYTATSSLKNTLVFYHDYYLERKMFRISMKVITDASISDLEAAGIIAGPGREPAKRYSLTFNKSYFALSINEEGSDDFEWLALQTITLVENTAYYLELNIDGKNLTGYIKDSSQAVLYTITSTVEENSCWDSYILLIGKSGSSTLQLDDYKAEIYY